MSSTSFRKFVSTLLLSSMSMTQAYAADLDYPELQVTPRASERLEMEAKDERGNAWLMHLPVQLGSVGLLTGSFIMLADRANQSNSTYPLWAIPMGIGGAWLGLTVGLAAAYRPYASGTEKISAMPRKSRRDELLRERMAEERLEATSALAWRLTILSSVTQFIGGGALVALNRPGSAAFFAGAGAAALSFVPFIFQYGWIRTNSEQHDYKKRIYGPIASATILPEPGISRISLAPGMQLSFAF